MIKVLDRYIFVEFMKPFLFTAALFSFLIQLGHLFDRLEVFLKNKVPVAVIVPYLFAMLPLWLVQILPFCTLIAAVVMVSNMSRNGELLCLGASGVSNRTVLKPLFLIGAALTLFTFVMGDTVMPAATSYARTIYRTYVDKIGAQKTYWEDIIVLASDKKRISAHSLDLAANVMEKVTVEEYGNEMVLRQALTARRAEWRAAEGWVFYDGVIRMFSKDGAEIVAEEPFMAAHLRLPEKPQDLVPLHAQPEEMSSLQLKRYIERIQGLGIPALREAVQFHFKFAFPFTHLLVLAIGLPVAFKTTQAGGGRGKKSFGQMQSLATALMIAFGYYALQSVGQALGESRKIEPWAAVWIGNVVFAALGVWFVRSVE